VPLCGHDPLTCNNICGCCCTKGVVIAPNKVLKKGTILARRDDGFYDVYDPAAPPAGTPDEPSAGTNKPRGVLKYDWTTDEQSNLVASCPTCPSGCTRREVEMYTCGEFKIEEMSASASDILAMESSGRGVVISGTAACPGVFKLY
jgi:hypothetical protein